MSRGQGFQQFNAAARSFLDVDVGPVDDEPCAIGPCETQAVYRVPQHSVGGDAPYCPYHLARYREQHPEIWDGLQAAVNDDLSAYATRGNRFLTLREVPETLFDEAYRAIALLVCGNALYELDNPEETVAYRVLDRRLAVRDSHELHREQAGEFLRWVEAHIGVHEWAEDVDAALYGGDSGAE